jgi:DNA polymerase III subunit epsilon
VKSLRQHLNQWLRPSGVHEARWVVLDVETSGLNPQQDALLAIAAIALRVDWAHKTLRIDLADSYEVVLQQSVSSSKENILLHGIGAQRQAAGVPAAQALQDFAHYCAGAPLLAFHAAFDRALIERYAKTSGVEVGSAWADIEHLCAVTHTQAPARSLDEWMAYFGVRCAQRHQAAADTLAECEVLLRVWPHIATQCASWRDVQKLAASHRWIQRR